MSPGALADGRLKDIEAIVMGGSAGSVSALLHLLPHLPAGFPLPILIVLHVPARNTNSLAELFQPTCRLVVKEAEDTEGIARGTVYFAPPNYHLLVEKDRQLSLSNEEPVNFSRPSIDVLFESAADAYGPALLAVILTGANHDGAQGVRAVCDAGGYTVVQTPESAEARAMPDAALAACPKAESMTLDGMDALLHFIR